MIVPVFIHGDGGTASPFLTDITVKVPKLRKEWLQYKSFREEVEMLKMNEAQQWSKGHHR